MSWCQEFSSHGDLLRELILPDDLIHPQHAIQLTSGQYIVCHGRCSDAVQRVCKINADGHIVQSHGGQPGSGTDQYLAPHHLAVGDELVYAADMYNQRLTLLSPTLGYVRQELSRDELRGYPWSLHLDVQRRRLYVANNERNFGDWTTGRVSVLSVMEK